MPAALIASSRSRLCSNAKETQAATAPHELECDERLQRGTRQELKRRSCQSEDGDCDRGDEYEGEGGGQQHRHMVGGQPERLRRSAPARSGRAAAEQLQGDLGRAGGSWNARVSARGAHDGRECALREAREDGEERGGDGLRVQSLGRREVRRQHRKRAPHRGEPEVRMKCAAEELQVVGHDDERADGDEEREPPRRAGRHGKPDRAGRRDREDRERDENGPGDPGAKRPSVQLVERVRADAHGEQERERRPAEQAPFQLRRERRADRDIGEVPERVRRVEQRHVVAPAAGRERVERGPRAAAHARRPHTTTPPPRLRRCAWMSRRPASRQSSSTASSG